MLHDGYGDWRPWRKAYEHESDVRQIGACRRSRFERALRSHPELERDATAVDGSVSVWPMYGRRDALELAGSHVFWMLLGLNLHDVHSQLRCLDGQAN